MSRWKDKYILNSKLETDNRYQNEDKSNIYDENGYKIIHALKYIGKDESPSHDKHQHSYIINGDLTEPTSALNGMYNIWKIPGLIINNGLFSDLVGVDKNKANYFTIPFTVNQSPRAILSEFAFRGDTLKVEEKLDGRNPINYNYLHQNINAVVEFEDIPVNDIDLNEFVIKHKKGNREDVFRANKYFAKDQDNKYIFDINNILQKSRLTQFPGSIDFGGLYDTLTLTQTGDLLISEKGITMPMNSKILPKQGAYAPSVTIHPAYEIQNESSKAIISPVYENNKINKIQNHELGNSSDADVNSFTFEVSSNFIIDPYGSDGKIFSKSENSEISTDTTGCWTFENISNDKHIISNQLKYIGDKCNFGSLTSETSECVLKPDANIYINEQNQNLHNLEEIRCQFEKQPSQFIRVIDEKGGETRVINSEPIQLHMWDKNGSPKKEANNKIPYIEVKHYNDEAFENFMRYIEGDGSVEYSQMGDIDTPYDYTQIFSIDLNETISSNTSKLPEQRSYIQFSYGNKMMAYIQLMQDAGYSLFGLNVNLNISNELNSKLGDNPSLYLAKITDSNNINLTDLLTAVSTEGFVPLKNINKTSGLTITSNDSVVNYQCVFNLNDDIETYFEGDPSKEFDYNGVYMIYMKTKDGDYLVPNYGIIYLNMTDMSITSAEEMFPKADGSEVENNQFDLYFSKKINENEPVECKIYKQYPIKIWLRHKVGASSAGATKELVSKFANIINGQTSSMKVSGGGTICEITTVGDEFNRRSLVSGEWDEAVGESIQPSPIAIWNGLPGGWVEIDPASNGNQYFYQTIMEMEDIYVPITSDGTPEPETLQLDELSYTNENNTYTLSGVLYRCVDEEGGYMYIFGSVDNRPYITDLNTVFSEPDAI